MWLLNLFKRKTEVTDKELLELRHLIKTTIDPAEAEKMFEETQKTLNSISKEQQKLGTGASELDALRLANQRKEALDEIKQNLADLQVKVA